jgi:hypothetical protein
VERLAAKLEIMSFMLTFYDLALAIRNVVLILPFSVFVSGQIRNYSYQIRF